MAAAFVRCRRRLGRAFVLALLAVATGGCMHPPPKSIDVGGATVGIGAIDVWSAERPTDAEKRRGGGVPGSD
ncbi:MAG: hypothetical protein MUF30_02930 [Burkholderiales bacterium]|nr:hypothetical protein [Burkholderiales bacterium]